MYVVSKNKLVSARTAQRPVLNTIAPPKHSTIPHGLPPHSPHDHSEVENGGAR